MAQEGLTRASLPAATTTSTLQTGHWRAGGLEATAV